MIKGIISLRGGTRFYFFQNVYEWEDAIQKVLGIPIKKINPLKKAYLQRRKSNNIYLKNDLNKDVYLAYIMNVESAKLYVDYNCVPIFADVFTHTADKLVEITSGCQMFFVTSWNMYQYLKNNCGCNNVYYTFLPVSDLLEKQIIIDKKLDVVQFGRQNKKLHEWMLKYVKEYSDVEYIYREGNWKSVKYYSTRRGNIGEIRTREQFLKMLGLTKVCLISARGKDEAEGEKGYDFITPRVFEAAAAKCQLIGRYSDGYDYRHCGLDKICSCPETYEEFRATLSEKLKNFNDTQGYEVFISKNKASVRIKEVLELIERECAIN